MITLDIPHADHGHTTLTFDPANTEQVAQAESQINELIRQGYSVFVEQGGKTERITKFDASKASYQIGSRETPAAPATVTAIAPPSGGCIAQ